MPLLYIALGYASCIVTRRLRAWYWRRQVLKALDPFVEACEPGGMVVLDVAAMREAADRARAMAETN